MSFKAKHIKVYIVHVLPYPFELSKLEFHAARALWCLFFTGRYLHCEMRLSILVNRKF